MAKCQECKRQASKIIPARYPKTTSTTQKQFGNLRIYQNMVQKPKVFETDKIDIFWMYLHDLVNPPKCGNYGNLL